MDLQDFFSCVLPDAGLIVICYPGNKGFVHRYYADKNEAAQAALSFDAQAKDVYFGCASYIEKGSRKASNVQAARSFWLDIDVGQGKPYATKREAAENVLQFSLALKLPRPMILSSGRGLHVYWPMEEDIEPADWKRAAEKLKSVVAHMELHADPSRTADIASILRPPGTHNRKSDPIPVEVRLEGQLGNLEEFEARLDAYIEEHELTTFSDDELAANTDLQGNDYSPSANADAEQIADQCAVMGLIRDTRGNVDQPTWYHGLQILGRCIDGEKIAHEWSNGHPDYTYEETQAEFERASEHRPTLCSTFAQHHPDLCKACPYFGQIKSPIKLGLEPAACTVEIPAKEPDLDPRTIEFPKGYKFKDDKIQREVQVEEDGKPKKFDMPILDTFCLLTERLDLDDMGMAYRLEYLRQGKWRSFVIPASLVAAGGKELKGELGKHELWTMPGVKDSEMQQYLKAWMDHQKEKLEARNCYNHYGWHELADDVTPAFLIGNKLLKPGGFEETVLLKDNAEKRSVGMGVKGDFTVWKDIIDRGYNHPGLEGLQFIVLCGFAAPLFSIFGDLGGVTVYAYSGKTGKGKSTACQAALSAWGNWSQMQLADKRTTWNAFWGVIGAYHNIPVVFDELTNMSPEEAGEVVFGMSHGRVKERMDASGVLRDNNSTWRTLLLATGNNMLSEKLTYNRADATPELARIFEFNAQADHKLSAAEAGRLFRQLLDNYGHAGLAFARYIVDNYDSVASELLEWRDDIVETFHMRTDERFWSALLSSVMLALEICKRLNILKFNDARMLRWIKDQLAMNRANQQSHVSDPRQLFARMLGDLTPNILETDILGDGRGGGTYAEVLRRVHGPLLGRAIQKDRVIWLSTDAVRTWCVNHKVSAADMIREVTQLGWIIGKKTREALGKGTLEYGSNRFRTSVYVIDLSKVEADTEGSSAPRGPVAVLGGNTNVSGTRNRANSKSSLP